MTDTNFSPYTKPSAIAVLIKTRSRELGLTRTQLVTRVGYKNAAKGLRRLDELFAGNLKSSKSLIDGLPAALELSWDIVARAVKETQCEVQEVNRDEAEKADRAWRIAFKPHAYFATERSTPSQITMCAISGGPERWLKIPLDLTQPPLTFLYQALGQAKTKKAVPFFDKVIGVIINYTPDRAICFDLNGNPTKLLPKAWHPGRVKLMLGRRALTAWQIEMLFG